MSNDNKSLGTFRLDGIPPAQRGVPQIEVTFDIDANGILSVTAKDKGTGKEQTISITGASTLDKGEVDRMVRDAEVNSGVDKERRDKIDMKNQADSLAYQAEKQLSDLGDKVPPADKEKIEGLVKDLREAIQSEDADRIKSGKEALEQTLYQMTTNLYQQAGAEGGADAGASADGGGATPPGDDVIDADFTETK
jgi:molecular chaperone DnaK